MSLPDPGRADLSGAALAFRTVGAFVLYALVLAFLYAPSPIIYDADSYYHLAVAEEYLTAGMEGALRPIRGGLLSTNFGDKEVLFHILLEPFVQIFGATDGGRVALMIFGALLLTLVAHLSMRAVGSWGIVIPFWLLIGSTEFTWRLVRLRPELFALILIISALWLAGTGRYRWLLPVAALFALSYTAIHAFVGLLVVVSVVDGWIHRRWRWQLVIYPVAGALIGLLIHPQFPDNLVVWWYQSVEYFRFKGVLDVGTEIRPNFTDVMVMVNLGWFLGLGILWRSRKSTDRSVAEDDLWLTFGVGAGLFGLLYLLMSRFSFYWIPLTTLWLLFLVRHKGGRWTSTVRLPWHGRVHTGLAWLVCVLVSLPVARGELRRYRERTSAGPDQVRVADREAFGRAVPEGAHVLAPWRTTPIYMFYAPQGRYLNVLDPVFLAATEPEAHRLQKEIFDGSEPDVPMAAISGLDSRWIAFPVATGDPVLTQRLLSDPRVRVLHRGSHWLMGLESSGSEAFVTRWQVVPAGSSLPPDSAASAESWEPYPVMRDGDSAGLEGYVDARRVSTSAECIAFTHRFVGETARQELYELASSGPSVVWLDGEAVVQMRKGNDAVLGRGAEVALRLSPGSHLLTVLSCVEPVSGRNGFYFVRRESTQS